MFTTVLQVWHIIQQLINSLQICKNIPIQCTKIHIRTWTQYSMILHVNISNYVQFINCIFKVVSTTQVT